MRRRLTTRVRRLSAASAIAALVSTQADAQTLVTAGGGASHGGTVAESPAATWIASGAYWATTPFGIEVEVARMPDFFPPSLPDRDHWVSGSLSTVSVNVILGAPVGGRRGFGLRPYLSGGPVAFHVAANDPFGWLDVKRLDIGYNVGGGFMILFNDHIGMRWDLRYLRDDRDDVRVPIPGCSQGNTVAFTTVAFRRSVIGAMLRF